MNKPEINLRNVAQAQLRVDFAFRLRVCPPLNLSNVEFYDLKLRTNKLRNCAFCAAL